MVHDEQANGLGPVELEGIGDEGPSALGHCGGFTVDVVGLEIGHFVVGHDGVAGFEVGVGFSTVDIVGERVGAGFEVELGVGQAFVDLGVAGDFHGVLSTMGCSALRKCGVADARLPNGGGGSVPVFETGVAQEIVSRGCGCRLGIGRRSGRGLRGMIEVAECEFHVFDLPGRSALVVAVVAEGNAHFLAEESFGNVEVGRSIGLPIGTFRPFLVEHRPSGLGLGGVVGVGDEQLLVGIALVVAENVFERHVRIFGLCGGEIHFGADEVVSAGRGLLRGVVVARSLGRLEVNLPCAFARGGLGGECTKRSGKALIDERAVRVRLDGLFGRGGCHDAALHFEILDFPSGTALVVGVVAEGDVDLFAEEGGGHGDFLVGERLPITAFRPFLVEHRPTLVGMRGIEVVGDEELLIFVAFVVAQDVVERHIRVFHAGEVDLGADQVVGAGRCLLGGVVIAGSFGGFEVNFPCAVSGSGVVFERTEGRGESFFEQHILDIVAIGLLLFGGQTVR